MPYRKHAIQIISHLLFVGLVTILSAQTARAQQFVFDKSHTYIGFSIDHHGYAKTIGRFGAYEGQAVIDFNQPEASSIQVEIEAASLDTGWPARDNHLRGRGFLNTAEHPIISFVSDRIDQIDDRTADVAGRLTMTGQTHEVTMRVVLNKIASDQNKVGFSATFTIERSRWGVSRHSPAVGEEVAVVIETEMVAR
ncbi:MAG: YceI family protein [Pseudomonadota bacterium]